MEAARPFLRLSESLRAFLASPIAVSACVGGGGSGAGAEGPLGENPGNKHIILFTLYPKI